MLHLIEWLLSQFKLWWQLSPVLSLLVFTGKRLSSCSALSYLFNGLKFQLDFICLGFAPHDVTIIMWFWLEVVICYSSGGATNKLNTLGSGYYLIWHHLKPIFTSPLLIIIAQSLNSDLKQVGKPLKVTQSGP